MKEIQELLKNLETFRVEIYYYGIVLYNIDTCEEESFDNEADLIEYLKSL